MSIPKTKYKVKKSGYVDPDGRIIDGEVLYSTKHEWAAVQFLYRICNQFKEHTDPDWFGVVKYQMTVIENVHFVWDSVDDYGESGHLKRLYEFKEQYPNYQLET